MKDRRKEPARETTQTAALDNQGIIQLQQQMMREQDAELEELEKTVTSTKVGTHKASLCTLAQQNLVLASVLTCSRKDVDVVEKVLCFMIYCLFLTRLCF